MPTSSKSLLLAITFLYGLSSYGVSNYQDLHGKTFAHPGPNCFGVALYANGNTSTIRGVDLKEFSSFVENHCQEIEEPTRGAIGTFHNGRDFIHAFIELGNGLVLEKTGVDYLGQTPVHVRDFSHTRYTFEASPECRRWGGGSRDCFNDLKYFDCSKEWPHSHQILKEQELLIEKAFSGWLSPNSNQRISKAEIANLIIDYERKIMGGEFADQEFLLGRLESFEKQLLFLK